MPESLWVAELIISERTRAKITTYHNVDPFEVRQAIVAVEGLRYKYRWDLPRGPRYYVEFFLSRTRALATLYPVAHQMGDVYALGSTYREPRGLAAVEDEPTLAAELGTSDEQSGAEGFISGNQNVNEIDEQLP